MKNFLTHKFLPVMAVFMLVIFTLSTSVFAADTINFTYNDTFYSVPDVSSFITSKCDIALIYVKDDVPILHISSSSQHGSDIIYPFFRGTLFAYNSKIYKLVDGKWSYLSGDNDEISNYSTVFPEMVVYCNVDLYDDNGNVVFPVAPQATQLAQIVEQAKTEKTLAEVVGILPLILVVVVSLVGLRKALKWLLTFLRRCLILLN